MPAKHASTPADRNPMKQGMPKDSTATAAKAGIGFGTALAITISWSANKSILWAMLHGLLSWIYVIYYAIKHA